MRAPFSRPRLSTVALPLLLAVLPAAACTNLGAVAAVSGTARADATAHPGSAAGSGIASQGGSPGRTGSARRTGSGGPVRTSAAAEPPASRPGAGAPTGQTTFWGFDSSTAVPDSWEERTTGVSTGAVARAQQAYLAGTPTAHILRGVPGATGGVLELQVVPSPGYRAANGVVYPYQSAQLRTQGHFSFTYGTVSARIRLGVAPGIWPALWMVGTDYNTTPFPASGEIDMMETIGYPDEMREALHGPGYGSDDSAITNAAVPAGFDSRGWHVYSCTVTRTGVSFSIDSRVVFAVSRAEVAARHGTWVFDKPRSLVLTLAVGGDWAHQRTGASAPHWGVPAATDALITSGGATMEIDYIRVVQA